MEARELEKLFPAFLEIGDEALREQAERAMLLAMEQGGWDESSIRLCPVTLNWEDCDVSWVEHVTDVTKLCMMEYGALLHDIGKLTEFTMKDGSVTHGKDFELMRHPLSGALIASRAGLPNTIVHLIATHSFEGDRSYHTAESAFVRTIDIFVFNASVAGLKKR